jgi:hypothetical protein
MKKHFLALFLVFTVILLMASPASSSPLSIKNLPGVSSGKTQIFSDELILNISGNSNIPNAYSNDKSFDRFINTKEAFFSGHYAICLPWQNWSVSNNTVPPAPVPEPLSLILLGTGMIGFGLFRNRRVKNNQ